MFFFSVLDSFAAEKCVMALSTKEKNDMKTVMKIVLIGFLILIFSTICTAENYNFRKTKWGMSIAEVKSSEPLDVTKEEDNLLGYKTVVIGKDVLVAYFFIDNQLVRTRYVLAESHTNNNDYIADYNDFKKILIKKYGPPRKDETFWKNDQYKDDYSHWGLAISMGHLIYYSNWETEDTEINNMLMGDNYDTSCIVEYSSKNLKEIEKKAEEKKALEAF